VSQLKVVEHSSAEAFLQATEAYRAADPLQTNLLGSIAEGVRAGRRYDSETWLTVHDRASVIGAALRTAPYSLLVGPMTLPAARALGDHLRAMRRPLPGINGPGDVVTAVAEGLGHPIRVRMRDVLRVLDLLVEPSTPDGSCRRANEADLARVTQWQERFLVEVGLPPHLPDDASIRLWLERLWLWEIDGEPVAMAGHAPVVSTPGGRVGRIGPVYTVPEFRRRGIGAALTAVVSRVLVDDGAVVMLYADADNATSNGVYERLGFRAVAEHLETDLL
jgi:predicted GNAT family acetyltransferase